MYHFDHTPFKPDISKCIEILISDTALEKAGITPHALKQWCRANTRTYIWMEEVDTTDVSMLYDYIYAFYFIDEEDANWFKLRWL